MAAGRSTCTSVRRGGQVARAFLRRASSLDLLVQGIGQPSKQRSGRQRGPRAGRQGAGQDFAKFRSGLWEPLRGIAWDRLSGQFAGDESAAAALGAMRQRRFLDHGVVVGCRGLGCRQRQQQTPAQLQLAFTVSIGEQAVVANLHQTLWPNRSRETAQQPLAMDRQSTCHNDLRARPFELK